jgi:hypothetical protein
VVIFYTEQSTWASALLKWVQGFGNGLAHVVYLTFLKKKQKNKKTKKKNLKGKKYLCSLWR